MLARRITLAQNKGYTAPVAFTCRLVGAYHTTAGSGSCWACHHGGASSLQKMDFAGSQRNSYFTVSSGLVASSQEPNA